MSGAAEEVRAGAAADAAERVPLDRVMLAMDVVDTLRHQRELVERELDDAQRRREFVRRVQEVYDAQGIDVSTEVIEEGVQALEQDRFVYTPPPRAFAVRLAEVYVERGKWAMRAGVAGLLLAVVYLGYAIPSHYARQRTIDGFALRVAEATSTAERLLARVERAAADQDALQLDADRPAILDQLRRAREANTRARALAAAALAALTPSPDPRTYPDDRTALDVHMHDVDEQLGDGGAQLDTALRLLEGIRTLRTLAAALATDLQRLDGVELGAAERADIDALGAAVTAALDAGEGAAGATALQSLRARIDAIFAARQQLASLQQQFAGLRTALGGVTIEAAAAGRLAELRQAAEAALAAGDAPRASDALGELAALTATLDRVYELRIVSRPGVNSGVWRYPVDDRGRQQPGRNYYLVVEAIGKDGRPLRLPITSEEDQRSREVTRFGVRVPEHVFERVKRDKQDNGLIDAPVVGSKRRGALEPEFVVEVMPGRITQW